MSPMLPHDMSKVEKWGDVAKEGWYHVRVEKGEMRTSTASSEPMWMMFLKAQNEPFVGKLIMDMPSLQPHALQKLKAYYAACGYNPGPEGHDPEKLNGCECYVLVQHDTYQGEQRAKIPPYGIKSMTDGPGGQLAK
jgi:hypothetical protein